MLTWAPPCVTQCESHTARPYLGANWRLGERVAQCAYVQCTDRCTCVRVLLRTQTLSHTRNACVRQYVLVRSRGCMFTRIHDHTPETWTHETADGDVRAGPKWTSAHHGRTGALTCCCLTRGCILCDSV